MLASASNYHVQYMSVTQYWSPTSEKYAGGDALVTALHHGWKISPTIQLEKKWFAGNRQVLVYHFELTRDEETMIMPVINNPYVDKLVYQPGLEVIPMEQTQK
jgi:hypothetical protein